MTGLSDQAAASPQHEPARAAWSAAHASAIQRRLREMPQFSNRTLTRPAISAAQFTVNPQVVLDHAVRAEPRPGAGPARRPVQPADARDGRDRLVQVVDQAAGEALVD